MLALALAVVLSGTPLEEQAEVAIPWLLPSAYLHVLIHEASHVAMIEATGGKVTAFKPYPTPNGWIASTEWEYPSREVYERGIPVARLAPVVTETAWLLVSAIIYRNVASNHWKGAFFVEMLNSFIDLCRWYFTTFNTTGDGYSYRTVVVPVGAVVLPLLGLTAGLIAFLH
jgi:hypothetical protein